MSAIRCPRCQSVITAKGDPGESLVCPGCGARLRTRPTAAAAAPPGRNPNQTLPPGTPLPKIPRPAPPAAPSPGASTPASEGRLDLETLLAEVRAIKAAQEEILAILRERPAPAASPGDGGLFPFDTVDDEAPPVPAPAPAVRARRRKTVLLIDDDAATRAAATAALDKAEVPSRTAADGNAGLAAIAAEKPDVIVMELDMGGSMGGKDVVNMIKATMEWVDIPIVLYTRLPVENQKEARQIHGADEFVLKSAGPDALVARVITLFRKG